MEECGPCPVFASFTLAFALQLRKEHRNPPQSGLPTNQHTYNCINLSVTTQSKLQTTAIPTEQALTYGHGEFHSECVRFVNYSCARPLAVRAEIAGYSNPLRAISNTGRPWLSPAASAQSAPIFNQQAKHLLSIPRPALTLQRSQKINPYCSDTCWPQYTDTGRGAYLWWGKLEGKRPFRRSKRRWEGNINTLRTGDADLRVYITTVQDGWRKSAF
jgi:hypothetical protein